MIVGRDPELRAIDGLLETARGGGTGVMVIRGEAGIGKSALLEAADERARAERFAVLRATGLESEAELAYSGLLELCRPILSLMDALPDPQQIALRSALALGPATTVDRFAVAAATLSLLAEVAERSPLLILIDDAQWLDRASAEALWFALRRFDSDAVASLITVRTSHGDPLGGALDSMRFNELRIDGIDLDAAGRLLGDQAANVSAAVVSALHAGTAGNPLALIETARTLTDAELVGREALDDPVRPPARLSDVYARQIAALGDSARRALLVLAASGSDDHATLTRALSVLDLEIRDLLAAEDASLVILGTGSARFRHPLVRAAAYHAARPADRRAAHAALAAAAPGGSERAAWHRAEASLGPDESVASALELAAAVAWSRGGPLPSAAAFARAAALTAEGAPRARRLLRAAEAYWAAGATDQARATLGDAADACDDPRLLAEIRHLEGHILLHTVSPGAAHGLLLHEGLAISEVDPAKAAFMIGEAAEASLYLSEFDTTLNTARVGQELVIAEGGVGEFSGAALAGCGLVGTGHLDAGRAELRRAIEIFERNPELHVNERVVGWLVPVHGWLDDFRAALVVAKRAVERARARGALGELVYVMPPEAAYEYLLGSWPQSYAHISEAVQLARESDQTPDRILSLHGLAEIEAARGREQGCLDAVQEGRQLARAMQAMEEWPEFALGLFELGQGRPIDAIRALSPAVSLTGGQGQHRPLMAVFDLVEAHVLAGDRAAAGAVLDAVDSTYTGRNWELAGLARGRGMLATRDAYDDAFGASADILTALGMRFEAARTDLCWGERLRRDGRRQDCRARLRAALATFDELGAEPWAERTRNELRASGESIRRAAADRDELTARELQVALQAAEGKTNREVGAALYLSPKTVDIHLSRAYRKLGIHSRNELSSALRQSASAPGTDR